MVSRKAVAISPNRKTVDLRNLATGEVTTESYDKLVLSPGAAPIRPPLPGIDLQAHPRARAELAGQEYLVTGRAAHGEERERLWARWGEIDKDLDAYAARRPHETAVVVLEPVPSTRAG